MASPRPRLWPLPRRSQSFRKFHPSTWTSPFPTRCSRVSRPRPTPKASRDWRRAQAGLALGAAALTHAQADSSHEHLSHADLTAAPTPAALEPEMELETLHGVEPETLRGPATPSTSAAPAAPGDANAMVQAILADPNARQALLKALLSQGGEQVLREVAWEVMPDLASKLQK